MASTSSYKLILASASPRRLDLLAQIGLVPDGVAPADVDETPHARELPRDLAKRLAALKATTVAERHKEAFVLAADTVVSCGRRILPKPADEAEARSCLSLLSGRRHKVIGGISLVCPDGRHLSRVVETNVHFKRLEKSEIKGYLASQEWQGKAGGYAIQGLAAAFVQQLSGSYSNVVGLSLFETRQLLNGAAGIDPITDQGTGDET